MIRQHFSGGARAGALTPSMAEAIVDDVRREFGMGAAYHLDIHPTQEGMWDLADGLGHHAIARPMDRSHLKIWFMVEYADIIADRSETSEG